MSDDLISRSELIKEIEKSMDYNPHSDMKIRATHIFEHGQFIKMVMNMPTAFDKKKVMNEIKEYKEDAEKWAKKPKPIENADEFSTYIDAYKNCLEIVEKGGVE